VIRVGEAIRPRLVIFHSERDGRSRRVKALIAQVLQERQNHSTFELYAVSTDEQPELAEQFRVEEVPTLCVVVGMKLKARLERPRTSLEIRDFLSPWLR
jgi:thioredoxin-like negative regulator of GroEL